MPCKVSVMFTLTTARRSNQSILKEISPGCFFGRNDAKVETPVLWPLHAKSWLIRKDSHAGRDWGQEEKGTTEDEMGWMASPTPWTWVWVNPGSWWWTGRPGMLWFMGSQRVRHDWATELNWTDWIIVRIPRVNTWKIFKILSHSSKQKWKNNKKIKHNQVCQIHLQMRTLLYSKFHKIVQGHSAN